MSRVCHSVLLAGVVALPSSCVVAVPLQVRPPLSGQLLSSSGGTPLPGAQVTVESWSVDPVSKTKREKVHSATTRTDEHGRWYLRRERDWQLLTPAADGLPIWTHDFRFGQGEGAASVDARDAIEGGRRGEAVQRGDWLARFDPPRTEGPRLLPALGVMGGKGQAVCAYGGGLFVLFHEPLRTALRLDAELGLDGAAGFTGVALGAPTRELPLLNVDLGVRFFRRWTDDDRGRYSLGPALAFSVTSLRILAGALRATTVDAQGHHRWELHVLAGIGYL